VLVFYVNSQRSSEQLIRLHNHSRAEVRDVVLRWDGGKAGWVLLKPGEMVETKARTESVGAVELSLKGEGGIPWNFARERALAPGMEGALELRLRPGREVHWTVPEFPLEP